MNIIQNFLFDLLRKNGWKDSNNDGILEKKGQPLEIRVLIDAKSSLFEKIAISIRQQLAKIGIKLIVIKYDNYYQIDEEFLKKYKPNAWLRLFLGERDLSWLTRDWDSNYFKEGRYWAYQNSLLNSFLQEKDFSNIKDKELLLSKINSILYTDQPACFLFFPTSLHAISKKFKNNDEFFINHMPMYQIKEWVYSPVKLESVK